MDCIYCDRNLNEIGQDNMSPVPGYPICEECVDLIEKDEIDKLIKFQV